MMPTALGFWVPWIPQAMLQRWPFCWWVGVVLDHYSRAVLATKVYPRQPSAEEVCGLLGRAVRRAGKRPRHLVTDQGPQFADACLGWCKRRGVRPRFGAVGKHGSITVIERFIRSLKKRGPAVASASAAVCDRDDCRGRRLRPLVQRRATASGPRWRHPERAAAPSHASAQIPSYRDPSALSIAEGISETLSQDDRAGRPEGRSHGQPRSFARRGPLEGRLGKGTYDANGRQARGVSAIASARAIADCVLLTIAGLARTGGR